MSPAQLAAVLLAIGGFCFLLALAGTMAVIPLARRVGYVDRPGAHKSHRAPTPYGGGVAIFVAAWLPLTARSWIATSAVRARPMRAKGRATLTSRSGSAPPPATRNILSPRTQSGLGSWSAWSVKGGCLLGPGHRGAVSIRGL